MVHGSWLKAHGSWLKGRDSWLMTDGQGARPGPRAWGAPPEVRAQVRRAPGPQGRAAPLAMSCELRSELMVRALRYEPRALSHEP